MLGVVLAALVLAGCDTPASTLDPAGPAARIIARLWWVMLIGATVILALVMALALYAFRTDRRGRDTNGERLMLAGGIALPLLVLPALLLVALRDGELLLAHATPGAFHVDVVASRWQWRFAYPRETGVSVHTTNVLHIPVARPVHLRIGSDDVIHSFWVPRLGPKIDAIPGHVNRLELTATTPGAFIGLCSEFCGVGHAGMHFQVIAHPEAELQGVLRGLENKVSGR